MTLLTDANEIRSKRTTRYTSNFQHCQHGLFYLSNSFNMSLENNKYLVIGTVVGNVWLDIRFPVRILAHDISKIYYELGRC